MRAIVTCGPSYEPVDAVRRLTNFSTGELGILLTNALHAAGVEVICMKGAGATCAIPVESSLVTTFTTNDHLRAKLERTGGRAPIGAVFHAAALADFRVKKICDAGGNEISGEKLCSRAGELTLTLAPAAKVIDDLRALFPEAFLVGWKYELDGTREEAIAKGRHQITQAKTDLCVINGKAYGAGFGVLDPRAALTHCKTKQELCADLVARCLTRARAASPA
jgi:phosphopantothenoylcysteine synthetase/decarboxylase